MKKTNRCFLILLAVVLLCTTVFVGCKGKGDGEVTTQSAPTDTTPIFPLRPLTDYTLVRPKSCSDALLKAVQELNSTVQTVTGKAVRIKTDELEKDRNAFEIVIGDTARAESAVTIADNEFVIRSVTREDGAALVVKGHSETETLAAIYELQAYLLGLQQAEDGNINLPEMSVQTNLRDLGYFGDALSDMVILYPENADTMLTQQIRSLRSAVYSTSGKQPRLVAVRANAAITDYPNAIVIGCAGKEATAIKNDLIEQKKTTSYQVKVEKNDAGLRVWLVGADDLATARAVMYFYTQSVENGDFRVPKYLDLTVTPCGSDIGGWRDCYILLHEGVYYGIYNAGDGYGIRTSTDLFNWSAGTMVFNKSSMGEDWKEATNFWAPELHYYQGNFYIFATYKDPAKGLRGGAIFRSTNPLGQYTLISKGSANATEKGHLVNTAGWETIDPTLYVDPDGKPWVVFVYEWTSTPDGIGRMAYAPLSDDLTHITESPKIMFKANDPSWTTAQVTDGPTLYTCEDGTLLMTWSNGATTSSADGYAVGVARSSNGRLDGEWEQMDEMLYCNDRSTVYNVIQGGHAMILHAKDGRMYLILHTPNTDKVAPAAMQMIPLVERNGMLYQDVAK